MDIIDANWIRSRLSGRHGEKIGLADAMGITPDKLTKILNGTRRVQPQEMKAVVQYFNETLDAALGLAETPALFRPATAAVAMPPTDRLTDLTRIICPDVSRPFYYIARTGEPMAAILPDDVLIVAHGAPDRAGQLVLVSHEGDNGEGYTRIWRNVPPLLISLDYANPAASLSPHAPGTAIIGHIKAVIRASGLIPAEDP